MVIGVLLADAAVRSMVPVRPVGTRADAEAVTPVERVMAGGHLAPGRVRLLAANARAHPPQCFNFHDVWNPFDA